MFHVEAKSIQRYAHLLQRVLIIDPHPAAARVIADLVREMGGRQVLTASATFKALDMAPELEPQVIFVELVGPELDGLDFTRRLRRSAYVARYAPVIMVTREATAVSIKAARDAGVHEFLRKPFSAGDVFRRIENVVTKERPWIDAKMYVGPDRRRFNSGEYTGPKKRQVDARERLIQIA